MTKTMTEHEIKVGLYLDTPDGKSGVITFAEQVCPGVFSVGLRDEYTGLPHTFYLASAGAVSKEAARYGTAADGILFFEEGVPGSGWEIVDFEVSRYKLRQGASLESDDIYTLSRVYCERYPEYFGGLEAPKNTPFGRVIRLKKAAEGLYFAETERLRWLLAAHHVIWQGDDLSGYAKSLGVTDAQESDTPYMFFTLQNSTPAICELLDLGQYRGLLRYIRSKKALAAQLYRRHFAYVVNNNLLELSGRGASDMAANLAREAGLIGGDDMDNEQARREKNCLALTGDLPDRGLFLLP